MHVHTFVDSEGVQRAHCRPEDCDYCTKVWAIDDREKIRSHMIASINGQLPLLDLALHANGAGRTAVVEDHVERVRDALTRDRTWLRDQ